MGCAYEQAEIVREGFNGEYTQSTQAILECAHCGDIKADINDDYYE